jgi:segregation and condensation protein B
LEFLKSHIEALIFAAPQPIPIAELVAVLQEVFQSEIDKTTVRNAISASMEQYKSMDFPFEIIEIAGGFQFLTKGAFHNSVAIHLKQTTKKRLSQSTLETLAIVAYKQPVSKSELEQIRGVDCNYAMQKLLEKELVAITGRSDGPGRPLLYGTSDKFMDYLGIKSLQDLPKPKDFKEIENTIGEVIEN